MTKKVLRCVMTAVLLIIAATAGSQQAEAQMKKGEMTLGIAGGVATYNSGGYADIYFQYTIAPHFRIAPEVGYIFRNDHLSGFEFSADMHFPFRVAKGFGIYPLVGLTLNNWNHEHGDSFTRFGADFGAGFDFYFTSNFKVSLQGKYSLMDDCSGGFFNLGFGYVF